MAATTQNRYASHPYWGGVVVVLTKVWGLLGTGPNLPPHTLTLVVGYVLEESECAYLSLAGSVFSENKVIIIELGRWKAKKRIHALFLGYLLFACFSAYFTATSLSLNQMQGTNLWLIFAMVFVIALLAGWCLNNVIMRRSLFAILAAIAPVSCGPAIYLENYSPEASGLAMMNWTIAI